MVVSRGALSDKRVWKPVQVSNSAILKITAERFRDNIHIWPHFSQLIYVPNYAFFVECITCKDFIDSQFIQFIVN